MNSRAALRERPNKSRRREVVDPRNISPLPDYTFAIRHGCEHPRISGNLRESARVWPNVSCRKGTLKSMWHGHAWRGRSDLPISYDRSPFRQIVETRHAQIVSGVATRYANDARRSDQRRPAVFHRHVKTSHRWHAPLDPKTSSWGRCKPLA